MGVDSVQNLAKYKRLLCVLIQPTNRDAIIMQFSESNIVNEHDKTKDVQGQGQISRLEQYFNSNVIIQFTYTLASTVLNILKRCNTEESYFEQETLTYRSS